jgi:hypothetical protein
MMIAEAAAARQFQRQTMRQGESRHAGENPITAPSMPIANDPTSHGQSIHHTVATLHIGPLIRNAQPKWTSW